MLDVLRNEKLYANLKKCTFCMDKFVFLRYSVNKKGIEIDEEIVKTIRVFNNKQKEKNEQYTTKTNKGRLYVIFELDD